MQPTMAFLDNTSTTSFFSDSTVSEVAETLSSVALVHPTKEPKAITDLPPEIILQIYGYLACPSEIAALNSTSRMYNWIWWMNASSISGAVLSRSISRYNSALELFEVEERIKQIYCIILPQSAILKRVRVAQKQARDVVRQGRRNDRRDYTSRDVLYRGVLYRNGELLSAARNASYLLGLIENKVVCSGGTSLADFDCQFALPRQDIIFAYYELTILIRLRILEAMKVRLKNMCKEKIRMMLYVATYLVCNCPDRDKIRLGISRKPAVRFIPWSWMIDDWDLSLKPRCLMVVHARRAFFAVADAVGEARIPDYMLNNRSGCHGDCENFGKPEAK